jgi:hypothetical protein
VIPRSERPGLDPAYGISAEEEGLLPWSWVRDQTERSRNYWVCTTRPDGRPHAMPVWGVWIDDTLWFSTGDGSVKARNLAADPRVAVHLESGDECVIGESGRSAGDRIVCDRQADLVRGGRASTKQLDKGGAGHQAEDQSQSQETEFARGHAVTIS